MAYQVPKSNHPWRRYANRVNPSDEPEKEKKIKSVKILVTEFAESWDNIKVVTTAFGREGEFRLCDLPQSRQAAWLAGILKRNYT